MYANFACDYIPLKYEPYQIRLVVSGNKLTYEEDAGTTAASLLEKELLTSSVISDTKQDARLCSYEIEDFFLASPTDRPEYMIILWKYIPDDI